MIAPVAERLRAQKYVLLPTAVAPAVGPVLGGWLVDTASWHWVFLVNLPVEVRALLFGLWVLPDFPGPGAPRFDLIGFVPAGGGLASVLYALTRASDRGWGSGYILVPLVSGVVLLALMVPWELRARYPMIDLRIVEHQLFRTTRSVLLPLDTRTQLGEGIGHRQSKPDQHLRNRRPPISKQEPTT
ncbi:hypothetical protein ACIRPU_41995 [Streptomyces sp. NPDC102259]|uniref:hypothetical protein n=1 Tax=Streptomyces sp. NPDC102259 TaxID=3366148 RepID=UPI0038261C61